MKTKRPAPSRLPDVKSIAMLRERPGVWLSFAGSAFLRIYAAKLRPLGLRPHRVTALAFVAENPGCTQAALGRVLGINRASAMALAALLQDAGFLQRTALRGRQQTALSLTALGQRRLRRACEIEEHICAHLFAAMTPDAYRRFIKSLQRIVDLSSTA